MRLKFSFMKKNILIILILLIAPLMWAQEIRSPNFAVASHPLVVESISFTSNHILIKLTIENKIIGGRFCVDKNIFIQNVLTNAKQMLSYSEGIPVCPESYNFKWIGEKLSFSLYFPKPVENIKYLNIIEDCDENCFSIMGVILNQEMNKLIDSAFNLFNERDYESSKETLLKIIKDYPEYPFGHLYLNLIQVLLVQENIDEAKKYYQIIQNSNFNDKTFILDQLKNEKLH